MASPALFYMNASSGGQNINPLLAWGYAKAGMTKPAAPTAAETSEKMRQGYVTQDPFALASQTNTFMGQQVMAPYLNYIPNYSGLLAQNANIAGQQMAGQISDATLREILTAASERGIMTGSPGSPNANAAYLSAVGKTSEELQAAGTKTFAGLSEMLPVSPTFNPASLFVPERFAQEELDLYNSLIGKKITTGPNSYATITSPQWTPTFQNFNV